MKNLLNYLFLRKSDFNKIERILKKENFEYTVEDIKNLLKGNQKGVRYGNIILLRNEGEQKIKRFFKVMLDGTWRTFKLFERQVKISKALDLDENYKSPVIKIMVDSVKFPIPYTVFETRENGPGFGFMDDKPECYEGFTDKQMNNLVETIYNFHLSGKDMKKSIWRYTASIFSDISKYEKNLQKLLNQKITHKKINGTIVEDKVVNILEDYFGITNISDKVLKNFRENFARINFSTEKYLVHADMQIDNIYKHEDNTIELLDFEWVAKTNSPSLAIMYDYGNLRARAWSSPKFQNNLDSKMLEIGKKHYGEDIVKIGLNLGLLRSSLMMSRFHLDFKNTVKKDKRTEEDYFAMFSKTINSLKKTLI